MEIKFEAIDNWNRPVFKAVNSKMRFGSVNILFDLDTTEEKVLDSLSEKDLCYFGNSFNCEPMGITAKDIQIVRAKKDEVIEIVSVTYSVELNQQIIQALLKADLIPNNESLMGKLEKIKGVEKAKYPMYSNTKIEITLPITIPKNIKVGANRTLWNTVITTIEQHII